MHLMSSSEAAQEGSHDTHMENIMGAKLNMDK